MSKTLATCSTPLFSRLHRHYFLTSSNPTRLKVARSNALFNSPNSLRTLCAIHLVRSRLNCASNSAASFSSYGGGGGGRGVRGGGDGGGGDGGGERNTNAVAGGLEEGSAFSPDVIILDVGGMTCGGCAASVKRILENQPHVSSASVNLATETAIVWPVTEAKLMPYWQKQLGELLAKHLTSCGFKSSIRGQGAVEEVLS